MSVFVLVPLASISEAADALAIAGSTMHPQTFSRPEAPEISAERARWYEAEMKRRDEKAKNVAESIFAQDNGPEVGRLFLSADALRVRDALDVLLKGCGEMKP